MIIATKEPRDITLSEISRIIDHNWDAHAKVSEKRIKMNVGDFDLNVILDHDAQQVLVQIITSEKTIKWATWCGSPYSFSENTLRKTYEEMDEPLRSTLTHISSQITSRLNLV